MIECFLIVLLMKNAMSKVNRDQNRFLSSEKNSILSSCFPPQREARKNGQRTINLNCNSKSLARYKPQTKSTLKTKQ